MNGKFNDISSADESKQRNHSLLFKNYKMTIHLFIDRRLVFERNNASLKKLSGFVSTDK
jgi:hypothetical protein